MRLIKVEKIIHSIPYGDRSGSVIEPYLTDQWFLNVKPLAKDVIKKVKNKETNFYPPSWTKTFFNWMNSLSNLLFLSSALALIKKNKPRTKIPKIFFIVLFFLFF